MDYSRYCCMCRFIVSTSISWQPPSDMTKRFRTCSKHFCKSIEVRSKNKNVEVLKRWFSIKWCKWVKPWSHESCSSASHDWSFKVTTKKEKRQRKTSCTAASAFVVSLLQVRVFIYQVFKFACFVQSASQKQSGFDRKWWERLGTRWHFCFLLLS